MLRNTVVVPLVLLRFGNNGENVGIDISPPERGLNRPFQLLDLISPPVEKLFNVHSGQSELHNLLRWRVESSLKSEYQSNYEVFVNFTVILEQNGDKALGCLEVVHSPGYHVDGDLFKHIIQ
jgi:hypothetical protein